MLDSTTQPTNGLKTLFTIMLLASKILKSYGKPHSLNTEGRNYIHVTFDYYCCYSPYDAIKIGKFLNSQRWTPHEVRFAGRFKNFRC